MAYELPVQGEPLWGDKINNSLEYVRGTAEDAAATAASAQSNANYAKARVDDPTIDATTKLAKSANLSDLPSASTARSNLGVVYKSYVARNARDAGIDATGLVDVTDALQAYIDSCKTNQRDAYFPRGAYLARQIIWPSGITARGAGIGGFGGAQADGVTSGLTDNDTGTVFLQRQGMVQDFMVFGFQSGNEIGPVHLEHFAVVGQNNNTYSHGMAFHDAGTAGNAVGANPAGVTDGRIQDTTTLANLLFTRWRRSGIYAPLGARPLHWRDVNLLWNGEYGLDMNLSDLLSQAVHLDSFSGDGNTLGLIRLKGGGRHTSVTVTNLKSEKRTNPYLANAVGQEDCLILEDCDDTKVQVVGLTHVSSVPSSSVFQPPGAAIVVRGTGKPQITYSGVETRVRSTDVAGAPAVLRDDALTLGDGTTKFSIPATATVVESQGVYGGTDGSYKWSQAARIGTENDLLVGESIFPRNLITAAQTLSSGQWRTGSFVARKTEDITKVKFLQGGTLASGVTTARVAIFEVADNGDATLIKSSTNDTSKFTVADDAHFTLTLSSTWKKIRGKRYAVQVIFVGTTAPTVQGASLVAAAGSAELPWLMMSKGGQTDIASSLSFATDISVSSSTVRIYAELLP